jgi:hypothetical protein
MKIWYILPGSAGIFLIHLALQGSSQRRDRWKQLTGLNAESFVFKIEDYKVHWFRRWVAFGDATYRCLEYFDHGDVGRVLQDVFRILSIEIHQQTRLIRHAVECVFEAEPRVCHQVTRFGKFKPAYRGRNHTSNITMASVPSEQNESTTAH